MKVDNPQDLESMMGLRVAAVLENTRNALRRIETTGQVTMSDAAVLSVWNDVWEAMNGNDVVRLTVPSL